MLALGSYLIGCILLCGLFFYDVRVHPNPQPATPTRTPIPNRNPHAKRDIRYTRHRSSGSSARR